MKIRTTVKECEDIAHVHYLLAVGTYNGAVQFSDLQRKELLVKARHWFERAYIYGGSKVSNRFAEACEQKARDLQPVLYVVAG